MIADTLLGADEPVSFQVTRPEGRSPFVLTCDHAGNLLPARLGNLGVAESELQRHIAWDIGAANLGRKLAARLDATLIEQRYSRLVIDVNRPPGTPESVVTLSERTPIPGNQGLHPHELRLRELEIFRPYHTRIEQELALRLQTGRHSVLIALHSFTPSFKDVARHWHMGVLYGRDARLGRPLLAALRRDPALVVGDNEPYAVSDDTDYTVVVHGEQRGIPHVELEFRQDLIDSEAGAQAYCDRLAPLLEELLPALLAQ